MDVLTLDFETYYDKEYSLSKLTTEQYIHDERFEVIGCGVKINSGSARWFSADMLPRVFSAIAWDRVAVLCHNTYFDGAILTWRYGIPKPMLWLDTLSMARPIHGLSVGGSLAALAKHYGLGEKGTEVVNALGKRRTDFDAVDLAKYGRYCTNDVDLTYALFRQLSRLIPASEVRLIDIVLRMYLEPRLRLDTGALQQHLDATRAHKEDMLEGIGLADAKSILSSNDKFAALLESLGVEPPMARSKATGEMAYSFSKSNKRFLDLLDHDDPRVSSLVAARLGTRSTLEEKRTERLIGIALRGGTLPVMLHYYGAHTGRFSGGDKTNLQNLPRGGTLRKSIMAPPGHTLVAADSSQIEARVLAWVAGQDDLVEAFRQGRDVYCEFAGSVYKRTISKTDTVERFVGKTCILGLGYGMGAQRFRDQLSLGLGGVKVTMDEHEAQSVVALYRATYPRIEMFWARCKNALRHMASGPDGYRLSDKLPSLVTGHECIYLPNKLRINYPMLGIDPHDTAGGWLYAGDARTYRDAKACEQRREDVPYDRFKRLYGGKITENLIQGLARIVITGQMLQMPARWPMVLQVHDEIVLSVPDAEVEEAKASLRAIMTKPPAWAPDLPVACSVAHGKTYGECK